MNLLVLLITLYTSVYAVTLEKYFSQPQESFKSSIDLNKEQFILTKNTNYFDVKKSLSVGQFKISSLGHEGILKNLDEVLKKIVDVDKALKQKGTSFNHVSAPKGHAVIFRLNEYVIGEDSKYFKILEESFQQLAGLNWKHETGYEVSQDFKTVKEIEHGKVKLTKEYATDFYCKKDICTYYGGGFLLR
jgi:hypothetical protein